MDSSLLPELSAADVVVGCVNAAASLATGFRTGTPVLCGMGDAAATTLGAGITDKQKPYLYVGTTGWVAKIVDRDSSPCAAVEAVFTLRSWEADEMIRIAPVLNAGNVLAWALTLLGHHPGEDPVRVFKQFDAQAAPGPTADGLMFVPFISPERCPIRTLSAHGAFIGISSRTTRAHMLQAVCEGLAQSLRWCGDLLGIPLDGYLRTIGGCTRSKIFMQALANAFGKTLHISPDSEMLATAGVGRLAARSLGWRDVGSCTAQPVSSVWYVRPEPMRAAILRQHFTRFQEVAGSITGMPAEKDQCP